LLLNGTTIGKNAKKARESNGFSQVSVADFLGVDQSLISKFEKGERTIKSEMLERLANLYGYTIADLIRDDGVPEQQLKVAYRSSGLTLSDMEVIHDIKRIANNLFFMTKLIDGDGIEK